MSIKCEVIHDLLPSYIDKLTSEESNNLVKRHLNECESCNHMYNEMKQEIPSANHYEEDISDKNEKQLMKRIKNKIFTVISTLIITFSILGFALGAFGNVLFQEGNPIPVISSIIKLEFTDTEFVEFSTAPSRYISQFKPSEERYLVVKTYMKEKGWEFKEQMGSGLIFEKNKEQIVVETRQYTGNYFIWRIPEKQTLLN